MSTQILQSALPDMPDKNQVEEYNYKVCQYTTLSQEPANDSPPTITLDGPNGPIEEVYDGIISIFDGYIYFGGQFLLENTEGTEGTEGSEGSAEPQHLWAKYPVVSVPSTND